MNETFFSSFESGNLLASGRTYYIWYFEFVPEAGYSASGHSAFLNLVILPF